MYVRSIRKIAKDIPNTKKATGRKARYVTFARMPGSVWGPVKLFITLCRRRNELRSAVAEPMIFAVSK